MWCAGAFSARGKIWAVSALAESSRCGEHTDVFKKEGKRKDFNPDILTEESF